MSNQLMMYHILTLLILPSPLTTSSIQDDEVIITDFPSIGYIIKNEPYLLYCRAINAISIRFKCNNKWISENDESIIEGIEGGIPFIYSSFNISSISEDEDNERCSCYAIGKGERTIKSTNEAVISIAYIRKHFVQTASSQRVREGTTVALSCLPPLANPSPTIEWSKDGISIISDGYRIIASDGSLLLSTTRLIDEGVYECIAKNEAGRRTSSPINIHVYVDGGWSEWSDWGGSCLVDCIQLNRLINERGDEVIPKITRRRNCNNPAPLNGGLNCIGNDEESRMCALDCILDGRWSKWSEWNECSSSCNRIRIRNCSVPPPINGGKQCEGNPFESIPCITGICSSSRSELSDGIIYGSLFSIFLLLLILISLCLLLLCRHKSSMKGERGGPYYGDITSYKSDAHKSFLSEGCPPPFIDSPIPTSMTIRSNRSNYARCESGYHTNGNESRQALINDGSSSTSSSARRAFVRTASSLSQEENYATVYECLKDDIDENDSVLAARVDREGARLSMHNNSTCLIVPENAFSSPTLIFLSTRSPSIDIPILSEDEICLSSIISISNGSSSSSPRYPFILSFNHCVYIRDQWDIFIYFDNGNGWTHNNIMSNERIIDRDDTISSFRSHDSSPLSSSIHCHIDTHSSGIAHCIMPSFGKVLLTGRPKSKSSSIRMRVAILNPIRRRSSFPLKVIIVPEGVGISLLREEEENGNRLLIESIGFPLSLDGGPICLCLEETPETFRPIDTYAEVPLNSPSSSYSTVFSIDSIDRGSIPFSGRMVILQKGSSSSPLVLSFTFDDDYEQLLVHEDSRVSLDFRLPLSIKQHISSLLDPYSERDWRSLSRSLGCLSFVVYGRSLNSPTTVLLTLWEAMKEDPCHLAHALRLSGRPEVAHIVEKGI